MRVSSDSPPALRMCPKDVSTFFKIDFVEAGKTDFGSCWLSRSGFVAHTGQTFGSLQQHSAGSWTQTFILGKVSAIWLPFLCSRYNRTSCNLHTAVITPVAKSALKTLKGIWIKSLVRLAKQLLRVKNQSAATKNQACKNFHDSNMFSCPPFSMNDTITSWWVVLVAVAQKVSCFFLTSFALWVSLLCEIYMQWK